MAVFLFLLFCNRDFYILPIGLEDDDLKMMKDLELASTISHCLKKMNCAGLYCGNALIHACIF